MRSEEIETSGKRFYFWKNSSNADPKISRLNERDDDVGRELVSSSSNSNKEEKSEGGASRGGPKKGDSRLLDLLGVSSEGSSEVVGPVLDVLDSRGVGNTRDESGEEGSREDEELFGEEEFEELLDELGL